MNPENNFKDTEPQPLSQEADLPKTTEIPPDKEGKTFFQKLASERRVSVLRAPERLLRLFSPGERIVLYALTVLLAGSVLALLILINDKVTTTVPSEGGALVEGAVGTPRFVNPLLAISQVDQDLTTLTYSGLMRATPGGDLVPDLAENYTVSDDGTVYTFHIRGDATFHDGTPVSAHDVAFTVSLAQILAICKKLKLTCNEHWRTLHKQGALLIFPDTNKNIILTL